VHANRLPEKKNQVIAMDQSFKGKQFPEGYADNKLRFKHTTDKKIKKRY